MRKRHSVLSFVCGLAVVAAAGACAQSGADKEHGPIFGADAAPDTGADTGGGNVLGDDAAAGDAAGDDASTGSGLDAALDTGSAVDAASDAAADASAPVDASDGGSAIDASDAGFVAPTCDGVIGSGEYGGSTHQDGPTTTGQTWYVTWDDTNLYVAISGATVAEGNVIYVASNPGDAGTGLTAGYVYDNTDITTLPFAADLVVYAKGSYNEARVVAGTAWGATANTTAVHVCTTGSTATVREEVIPWSLIGGRPSSFGWLGYLAANPSSNPTGYIYGQMPTDNPGGGPASSETYTKYFAVPDATPGVDGPFALEQ